MVKFCSLEEKIIWKVLFALEEKINIVVNYGDDMYLCPVSS